MKTKIKTSPRRTQYDKVMDALNLIDEHAELGRNEYEDNAERLKAYKIVADFIEKKAKH